MGVTALIAAVEYMYVCEESGRRGGGVCVCVCVWV